MSDAPGAAEYGHRVADVRDILPALVHVGFCPAMLGMLGAL